MKILSTTWSRLPDNFIPLTLAVTDKHIMIGGQAGARFRADLQPGELDFEPLPFPEELQNLIIKLYGYDDLEELEENNGKLGIDCEIVAFDFARVDWSTSPAQVAMNLTEYQGGSFGIWLEDGNKGSFLPSPHDADISFAGSYVLRGDILIAESTSELSLFRRLSTGGWKETTIAIPGTHDDFEIDDILLSQDACTLAVITDSEQIATAVFTYSEGHFMYRYNVPVRCATAQSFEHHTLSHHYLDTPHLMLWDRPLWHRDAIPQRLPLSPDEFPEYYPTLSTVFGDEELFAINSPTCCRVFDVKKQELQATIELPEIHEKYAKQSGAIVGRWLVLLAQNHVGVIELDRDDVRQGATQEHLPGDSTTRTGYARAKQIFSQFRDHTTTHARQILRLLEEIEPDGRTRAGEWLWRGIREGLVEPSILFANALSRDPDWYDVEDVLHVMDAISREDNDSVFAGCYQMILNTISSHPTRYVMFWATTRGRLRAELGYELAKRRKLPVQALPPQSLQLATRDVATCHLCGPRDISYSSRINALRRLYHDPVIARGMLDAVEREAYLGREMQQWFEFVWPHISAPRRVMLILRTSVPENVIWLADRFAQTPLTTATREELEATLAKLLVIEPHENMFIPSTRPYATRAFITAAMLLGQDAAMRRVGLGPVGGATFARALELGEMFPNMCGLTPEIEARLRKIYGT